MMNHLDLEYELSHIQPRILRWFDNMRRAVVSTPPTLEKQIGQLSVIRQELYEDLNQFQHRAWLLAAAERLQSVYPQITHWTWHPAQTYHSDFADLTGYVGEKVVVNAELTTSLRPIGSIAKHMASTLMSLHAKAGLKLYFVLSEKMLQRARHKIKRHQLSIAARQLPDSGNLPWPQGNF